MSKRFIAVFIAYVVFFAWLDWIMHRSLVFVIVVGGGLIIVVLNKSRIGKLILSGMWARPFVERWQRLPEHVRQYLVSTTPLLYFLFRGQGTSDGGALVVIAALLVSGAFVFFGHVIDPKLQSFYARRDKILARPVRMVLAPVLAILIAFLVVHGSLADLPALFGGETSSPQSPMGLSGQLFLATLLAAVCTALLLREGGEQA
ncbi:hypothetical protein [Kibdelosporangium aridum]|uniref:Uncharacterized protein n=1 Tax=Kibdelosporangium aridum TaxID=2030 RepID=A0A1Y5WWQ3_KIBAR|nr:hypothetical protein [Kibdelosporangium aridum]SMC50911.1 hypothetical protein SAMN05661093_00286 [Kibdelosporangium aridum]